MATKWTKIMRDDWDSRVKTSLHFVASKAKDQERFYEEGKADAFRLLNPTLRTYDFKPEGKQMLEIGCGPGRMFLGFSSLGFREIWGVDLSPEMLERGKAWCPVPGARFILGNGRDLAGVPDNYFDYCYSYNVFIHSPTTELLWSNFSEMYRVLKPGAVFQHHMRATNPMQMRIARKVPSQLRPVVRGGYRAVTLKWLKGQKSRRETLPGSEDTWFGVAIPPEKAIQQIQSFGFKDVRTRPDEEYDRDGKLYWLTGQKG